MHPRIPCRVFLPASQSVIPHRKSAACGKKNNCRNCDSRYFVTDRNHLAQRLADMLREEWERVKK